MTIAKEAVVWIIIGLILLPIIVTMALAVVELIIRILYWCIGFPIFLVVSFIKDRKAR